MTFDEIFQQYVAQGFTKPTAGVSGIETLMPTQAMPIAPITPIQQPQDTGGGRDDNFTNIPDTTTNLGITSLSDAIQGIVDLYGQLPTPINLAMKGIQNFQNPNTTIFGQPTKEYQQQLENTVQTINQNKQYFSGGDGGGLGNIGSDGADYSGSAQTGAKGGFGYGL